MEKVVNGEWMLGEEKLNKDEEWQNVEKMDSLTRKVERKEEKEKYGDITVKEMEGDEKKENGCLKRKEGKGEQRYRIEKVGGNGKGREKGKDLTRENRIEMEKRKKGKRTFK